MVDFTVSSFVHLCVSLRVVFAGSAVVGVPLATFCSSVSLKKLRAVRVRLNLTLSNTLKYTFLPSQYSNEAPNCVFRLCSLRS